MTTYTAPPNQHGLVLNNGDTLNVNAGGTATGTTINAAVEYVYANGKALDTTINAYGGLEVLAGSTATHTTINNGDENVVGGTSTDTTINGSGGELLGTEHVGPGGTATHTTINSNGVEYVTPYGTATHTTINSGGTEDVAILSTSTDTTINSGGIERVEGTDTHTTINNGGVEDVYGTSTGTTINSGGIENVVVGAGNGTATNTTINNGGVLNVSAVGTFIGTAVNVTFGHQNGAINTNTLLGSLNDTFSTSSLQATPGGTLDLAQPSELTGTISKWHVGDVIDFLNTAVTGVQENAARTLLTVTYGTNETAGYSLAGQQANTKFQLQSDGHGGTDLILTPVAGHV